jgi:hypothetical protein
MAAISLDPNRYLTLRQQSIINIGIRKHQSQAPSLLPEIFRGIPPD